MANGTVIIFNGGNILAKAAFHGSGIGGGYCNGNYFSAANNVRNSNAIVNTKDGISSKSVAGDITINGGYIRSYGSGHGNAFGQACCGTNTKKTITVTGGTLLPWSTTSASYYDIGGAGGYVVITGGSIKLTGAVAGEPYTGNKFQSGEGNKAYNAPVGDPNRQQIFMFCIDLSKSDGVGIEPVASWDLEIGGKPYEYGAPSYFDAGKLYLWLPFSAVGKEITVKLKRYNEDGSLKPVEDLSATPGDSLKPVENLSATPGDSSGSGLGKRWISYELTDEFKTENASLFSKYYDGESVKNLIASLESYVGTDGLPAPYEANKDAKLTNPDALLYQSAKLGDDGKPLDEYYPTEAVHDHKVLPTDSGSISMRVQSKEFAQPGTSTAESFWGHDTSFTVNIFPVNSKTEFTSYTLKSDDGSTLAQLDGPTWMQDDDANPNKASVNHLIVPVDVTSFTYPDGDTVDGSNMTKPTCAAPFGQVQLFLDDRPISAAHGGVMTFTREDLEDEDNDAVAIVKDRDGREHTVLLFDISRSQLKAHGLKSTENDEHTVAAVYTSRTDAKPATAPRAGAGAQAQAAAAPSAVYRNYYDSETERTFVQIQRSDCRFDLYNEKGTAYDPADGASTPIIDDAHAARTVFYDIADFTGANPSAFPLYVDTNSVGEVTFTSSNPAVLTLSPAKVASRSDRFTSADAEDFGFGATATVHAAGKTTITAVETAYNLTRDDGSIRPYDTLRYTATFTNETPNSSYQNPVLTLSVPADTTFQRLWLTDPEGNKRELAAGIDFTRQSVVARAFRLLAAAVLAKPELSPGAEVLTVGPLPALFGNQSYRLTMDVTVNPDVMSKTAEAMDFYSQSTANGVYGIDPAHDAQYPWDTRVPGTGTKVDEAWAAADPTSVEPADPDVPKPPTLEDVIGGGLVNPDPDAPDQPENPDDPAPRPGVEVGTTVPDGPLDTAKKPDPVDPDDPAKRTPDPILPGDRIVSVGDTPDPKTPADVQRAIDDSVKKKLEEDPAATEVEIPVIIERYDEDDPTAPAAREEVIITVAIPEGYDPDGPDPDDRDGHELVVIPADPRPVDDEEGRGADIRLAKTAENVTPDRDGRGNPAVVLVGDTIRYTVTVTNTRPGTCWYDAVVRDHIPAGLSYVAGSAVVTDAQSACHRDFPADFEDGTGDVAFSVGDVPGGLVPVSGGIKLVLPDGSETTCPDDAYSPEKGDVVVFAGPVRGGQKVRLVIDAVVTEDALGTDIGNVAFAYGTDPSGTETTVLTGDPSGTPGWRSEGIDGLEQAASEGTAFRSESKVTYPEGYDGQVRPNPAGDGDTKLKMRRLAKTGDEVPLALPLGLAMLAASALAVIALAARTNRRARG